MNNVWYGYKLESMNSSYSLTLYKRYARKRPSNMMYQATYYDVEQRWYASEERMIKRLLDLGFTRKEIDNTTKRMY